MPEQDLLEALVDKIAEAVVANIEERRKIDLIAEAVLARLEAWPGAEGSESAAAGEEGDEREPEPAPRPARSRAGKRATQKK